MTTATQTNGALAPETGAPPPDSDAAKWADLATELEDGPEEDEPEATPEPVTEPEKAEPGPQEPKPKPTYEELETNYRNTQAALHQARTGKRQSEERLTGITQLIETLRSSKAPAKAEPQAPVIPDINEDPIGHFSARLELLAEENKQLREGTQATRQHVQQSEQQRAFVDHVVRSEDAIRNPRSAGYKADYDEACQHLEAGRVAELAIMYPDNSPQAQAVAQQYGMQSPADLRNAVLNQDRIAVAQQAVQMGVSPAEMYYSLATQRGWKAQTVNGKTPAEKAAALIAATRKGQKAAVTISGGGGGKKSVGDMSIADLTDLYDEDPEAADKIFNQMAKNGLLG